MKERRGGGMGNDVGSGVETGDRGRKFLLIEDEKGRQKRAIELLEDLEKARSLDYEDLAEFLVYGGQGAAGKARLVVIIGHEGREEKKRYPLDRVAELSRYRIGFDSTKGIVNYRVNGKVVGLPKEKAEILKSAVQAGSVA